MYTQIRRFPLTHVNILSCTADYIWKGKQPYLFTLPTFLYYRSFTTSKHKFLFLLLSIFFLHCSAVFEKEPVWFFGTKILLGYLQEQCFFSTVWPYRAIKFHKCMCVCVCTSGGCVRHALCWNFSTEMASNSKSISFRLNIQGICPNQRLQFW